MTMGDGVDGRRSGRSFEDFSRGDVLLSAGRTVSEAAFDMFSGLTGDFSDVHMDAEVMDRSAFGGRIGHAILSLGVMQGLMWQTGYVTGTAVATLAWNRLTWPAPLLIGDTVHVRWSIADLRQSRSRPRMGILFEDCRLVNQHGATVLTGEHVLLVRGRAQPADEV